MRIERLSEDDWQRLRDLRLRALREDGDAFGSTLAREEGFAEKHWRMRLRSSAHVAAVDDDAGPVGIAAAISEPGAAAEERHVVSLWVAPERRRRGAAVALLDALADWARNDGATALSLWLVRRNDPGAELYRRAGFAPTGEAMPLPRDPSRIEERWLRQL